MKVEHWCLLGLIGLIIISAIFIASVITIYETEKQIAYQIDGTNITCQKGIYNRCGYILEQCSDGKDRWCVSNVIRVMKDEVD